MASSPVWWAGGKGRLSKLLLSHLPATFGDYHEPFCGGASLFLALGDRLGGRAFLSDVNCQLVNVFGSLRDDEEAVVKAARRLQHDFDRAYASGAPVAFYNGARVAYNRLKRATRPSRALRATAAALFLFLNRLGFGSVYRENMAGEYNIPFNRHRSETGRAFCQPDRLRAVGAYLRAKRADVRCRDFRVALGDVRAGDLVFMDPPYWKAGASSFTAYNRAGFGAEEQRAVKAAMDDLTARGARVMLTNANLPEVVALFREYTIVPISVARPLNKVLSRASSEVDVLIKNF